jgi:hypothetical protein
VIRESPVFPYVDGASWVQRLWRDGERESPFGDRLPLSTEQVLWPESGPPLGVDVDVGGARMLLDDTLGSLELRILAEDVLGTSAGEAGVLASSWDGDRWVLVEDASGRGGLVFAAVWSDVASRDRFLAAVDHSAAAFGGPVHVTPLEVDGRAVALLVVGDATVSPVVSLTPAA